MGQPGDAGARMVCLKCLRARPTKGWYEVAVTASELARLTEMIQLKRGAEFYKMLGRVKSEHSKASKQKDVDRIFGAVRDRLSGGFVQLDSMVFCVVERWMKAML